MVISIPETEPLVYQFASKYIEFVKFEKKDYSSIIFLDNNY
jgi:hypothetical protein